MHREIILPYTLHKGFHKEIGLWKRTPKAKMCALMALNAKTTPHQTRKSWNAPHDIQSGNLWASHLVKKAPHVLWYSFLDGDYLAVKRVGMAESETPLFLRAWALPAPISPFDSKSGRAHGSSAKTSTMSTYYVLLGQADARGITQMSNAFVLCNRWRRSWSGRKA